MVLLRRLLEKDAELMLEWMHDTGIQRFFQKNMLELDINDTRQFCRNAKTPESIVSGDSLHMAIADDSDEYLGTVSLKYIDLRFKNAEFAISTRRKVHGKSIAFVATGLMLKKAFCEYGLHKVYLSVLADNTDAIRLYERCGFKFEGEFRDHIKKGNLYLNLKWYGILDSEYDESIWE